MDIYGYLRIYLDMIAGFFREKEIDQSSHALTNTCPGYLYL